MQLKPITEVCVLERWRHPNGVTQNKAKWTLYSKTSGSRRSILCGYREENSNGDS